MPHVTNGWRGEAINAQHLAPHAAFDVDVGAVQRSRGRNLGKRHCNNGSLRRWVGDAHHGETIALGVQGLARKAHSGEHLIGGALLVALVRAGRGFSPWLARDRGESTAALRRELEDDIATLSRK